MSPRTGDRNQGEKGEVRGEGEIESREQRARKELGVTHLVSEDDSMRFRCSLGLQWRIVERADMGEDRLARRKQAEQTRSGVASVIVVPRRSRGRSRPTERMRLGWTVHGG